MAVTEKQTIFLISSLVVILIGRGYLIDKNNAAINAERAKYFHKKINDLQHQLETLKAKKHNRLSFKESATVHQVTRSPEETENQIRNPDLKIDSLENLVTIYTDSLEQNNLDGY